MCVLYLSQISASQRVFEKGATVATYLLSNKEGLDYKMSVEEMYTKTWRGM
jgi:hypothetical protein